MSRLSTIELFKERMGFSAGHFTIFSASEREKLHGHNYQLHVALTMEVDSMYGLTFDYREYKDRLYQKCRELNETFLLPQFSPYLIIEEEHDYVYAIFNKEKIPFLRNDVKVLPIANVTVEELSRWFLECLIENKAKLAEHRITQIDVKVSSSPGQFGSSSWTQQLS